LAKLFVLGISALLGAEAAGLYVASRTPDLALGSAWPWSYFLWRAQLGGEPSEAFGAGLSLLLLIFASGVLLIRTVDGATAPRVRGWAGLRDAAEAGLLENAGCVLGELNGRLVTTEDLRPTLVTGGTRSGKGRGHVVPSLLSWTGSTLVHDPKGELWLTTAGWRSTFSHALLLDPRSAASARFNPLAEIRPGPQAVAQVQRLVAILSDPSGRQDLEVIWDKAASEILEAVILHVLYTAPDAEKNLVTVRRLLADLDATAEEMLRTHHRVGPTGQPETHPFIEVAATGYGSMHDRFRTSVQGTARSYLKWLAGEDVERALSGSDFQLGDLVCAEAPVSLYVRVAPADAVALKPLVRLLFYAAAQSLTVAEHTDATGAPKRHRLLMAMDEFPLLGRLEFFGKSLRLMSGYGIKPMLVAQSLNDIVETYGPNHTFLDNCHVYTAFAAADPLTAEKGVATHRHDQRKESLALGSRRVSGGRTREAR
jgi:type IV secretion system protein VirD4